MFRRSLQIYWLCIASVFNKLRYNYLDESITALCAAIIFFLFFYIFNDFINTQIDTISVTMKIYFANVFSYTILAASSIFAGKKISEICKKQNTLDTFAFSLGESQKSINFFYYLLIPSTIFIYYVPMWFTAYKFFISFKFYNFILTNTLMFILSYLSFIIFRKNYQKNSQLKTRSYEGLSEESILFSWRKSQILKRNPRTKHLLILSLILFLLFIYLSLNQKPFVFHVFLSLLIGEFIAFSFAFQIASDSKHIWIEKNIGISHTQYINTLIKLGFTQGLLVGFSLFFIYCMVNFLYPESSIYKVITDGLKLSIISFVPPWILPYISMQIDPKKPAIQIISSTICGIFIGTAIFANLLFIGILPFIAYYGLRSQNNRFYRI